MSQPTDAASPALTVVCAPVGGVLELGLPKITTAEGEIVLAGQELGRVGGSSILAPLSGWLVDVLAGSGQQVAAGQAIARLHPLSPTPGSLLGDNDQP